MRKEIFVLGKMVEWFCSPNDGLMPPWITCSSRNGYPADLDNCVKEYEKEFGKIKIEEKIYFAEIIPLKSGKRVQKYFYERDRAKEFIDSNIKNAYWEYPNYCYSDTHSGHIHGILIE